MVLKLRFLRSKLREWSRNNVGNTLEKKNEINLRIGKLDEVKDNKGLLAEQ